MASNRELTKEINYLHTTNIHNQKAAMEILPYVFDLLHPRSVLDVGCGTGSWLAASKTLGVTTVKGIDGIQVGNSHLEIEESEFMKHDLTKPLSLRKKFDLEISLEVAEHLPETASNTLIETLAAHSNVILFSAAIPGQGGQHHYNEQWPEYWHQKFKDQGFLAFDILRDIFWNNQNVDWWYKQNIVLYARPEYSDRLGHPTTSLIPRVHPELFSQKLEEISKLSRAAQRFSLLNPIQKLKSRLSI